MRPYKTRPRQMSRKAHFFGGCNPRAAVPGNVSSPLEAVQNLDPTVELGGAFKDQGHGAHLAVTPSHVVAGPPGSGATTARWSDERLREGWDRLEFTAAATRVHILTFWGGTGALRRRTCCTCAWPPGGKIGPSLCLYGRASIIPAPTWRDDGGADPGWETYHLGDAFFIFPPGHAEAPHTVAKCCPRMEGHTRDGDT